MLYIRCVLYLYTTHLSDIFQCQEICNMSYTQLKKTHPSPHITISVNYFVFISKPRAVESRKIKAIHLQFVNMCIASNQESTAQSVKERPERQSSVQITKKFVCEIRRRLNWSAKHMKYGQLISHKNVKHRPDWCIQKKNNKDTFRDIIFVHVAR